MTDHMSIAAKVLSPQELLAWTLAVSKEKHLEVIGALISGRHTRSDIDAMLFRMGIREHECEFTDALCDAHYLRRSKYGTASD